MSKPSQTPDPQASEASAGADATEQPVRKRRRLTGLQPLVVGVAAALVVGIGVGLGGGALLWKQDGTASAAKNSAAGSADAAASEPAVDGSAVDTSPQQVDRVRTDPVEEAVHELKDSGFKPVKSGKLTIATTSGNAPLTFHASDGSTVVGSEVDVAQLLADGLDLDLEVKTTSWADWPLGVQSGKYDVVVSNVGVTEERKDLFDFATYRHGLHSFLVRKDAGIKQMDSAADIAGKKIVVGSGTNQEKILQAWNESNKKKGLDEAELVYYDDTSAGILAVKAERADAYFGPNPSQIYQARVDKEMTAVGLVNAGWPDNSDVGVATAKDNGLVESLATVLEHDLKSGDLKKSQQRWGLESEVVEKVEVNPAGMPKPEKKD
ncbi:transporter substrate-binding domain-containing protein [Galactobacter sp.]|uniref:transporter substrate-binding domain-containing protein n=1 Tax=Galactobacter sp. TaxID=2676125 RepID=UPI0025C04237|nr:transporter substrate-binding domain-containing protein [Galactobacter sp.]